jgi:hypothetical protein
MCDGCDRSLLFLGVHHLEAILGEWLARLWYHLDDVKDENLHMGFRRVRMQTHTEDWYHLDDVKDENLHMGFRRVKMQTHTND